MKKVICVFAALFLFVISVSAESYKITSVEYETSGLTREYALSQKVPVDTETVFPDYESFSNYIDNLKQILNNQRVFQSTSLSIIFADPDENNLVTVNLLIMTVDTLNIIGVPYPSYNSNTGITLKLKVKDYNFLGSMETMDFDLNYQAKGTDDLQDVTHVYGINFGFSVPFKMFLFPASWTSNFSFSYTVGNPQIDMNICEGINTTIPIAGVLSAGLSFNQYYIQNSEYISAHDDKYFQELVSLTLPINVWTIPNLSTVTWTPGISFSYIWDTDVFKGAPDGGITSAALRGPVLSFSHVLSTERINWFGNFRDGFSGLINQTVNHNLFNDSDSMSLIFTAQYHKKFCSFAGFSTRNYSYFNFDNSFANVGTFIRGIRDSDWTSWGFLAFNLDFPLSLFHTNWGKLIGWDKLNFFNFEFQVSPFLDFVIGKNQYSATSFKFKDGWYGTGLEMILYPDCFRSIQARVSFGVDAVQFLQKAGTKASFLNGCADKLFNTGWRSGSSSWYELSIGIGFFY